MVEVQQLNEKGRKMTNNKNCNLLVFTFLVLLVLTNMITFYTASTPEKSEPERQVQPVVDLSSFKEFSDHLVLIIKDVIKAKRYARSGKTNALLAEAHRKLDFVLKNINVATPKDEVNATQQATSTVKQLVCPEVYKGNRIGHPFYQRNGWQIEPCSNVPPLNTVITILLNFKDRGFDALKRVLKGIEEFYPMLHVFVATDQDIPESLEVQKMNLAVKRFSSQGKTHGIIWNELMKAATTNYILIGRDIERITWDIRLERMIRVANNLQVDVVGGAIRTPDGHWTMGCRQFVMMNYTLAYIEGYDMSRNACLYCEHLVGPFVGRTEVMKTEVYYLFDEDLDADVLFEDLFIRIKRNDKVVMTCPDSLFFVEERESKKEIKETWVPLLRKWELSKVQLYNRKIHSYTCEAVGLKCNPSVYRNMIKPACCLELLSKAMCKVFEMCDKNKLLCESQSGNLLGSVKLSGVLPWERDADIFYTEGDHSTIVAAASFFRDAGMSLSPHIASDGQKYFLVGAFGWKLDVYSKPELTSSVETMKAGMNRTCVFTDGCWQPAQLNPGMYVRGRYGAEVFKHAAQGWSDLGCKTGYCTYNPGSYVSCPKPGHHACLDYYLGDGSIQFMGPWL